MKIIIIDNQICFECIFLLQKITLFPPPPFPSKRDERKILGHVTTGEEAITVLSGPVPRGPAPPERRI